MKRWTEIGKPWGIGEHSMAYYGTPEQVAKYNGERAYESQEGRMEGLANECYNLIVNQRQMGVQPRNRPMDLVDLNGMWPQFPDYLIEGNEAHRLLQAKFMSEISGG